MGRGRDDGFDAYPRIGAAALIGGLPDVIPACPNVADENTVVRIGYIAENSFVIPRNRACPSGWGDSANTPKALDFITALPSSRRVEATFSP